MANEAQVRSGLTINATGPTLQYSALPSSFTADVTGRFGPTPGAITVATSGTDVDLTELAGKEKGFVRMMNLDSANYVIWGIWDGSQFIPVGEILPGESYVFRLWRDFGGEFATGTSTATTDTGNTLRIKATGNTTQQVLVEAFEK